MTNANELRVVELETSPDDRWNRYVDAHPQGTCFHLCEWPSVSRELYGWRSHYLFAERDDVVCGVLPLVMVRNLIGRTALVSTPYCVYGGPLADDSDIGYALEDAAAKLARSNGCAYLELRETDPARARFIASDLYVTFKKDLHTDHDKNLAAVPRKQRAMIRKGEKAGLRIRPNAELGTFYELFCRSMHTLGTPSYSKQLFETILKTFPARSDILLAEHDGVPVAGILTLYFRDEVIPYYAGSVPSARALAAFDYLYWELMKRAVERGCRRFDFGRSMRGTGAYAFKKNWGFKPSPLAYQYDLINVSTPPIKDPNRQLYKTAAAGWRKLPLPLAKALGPLVARGLY